MSGKLGLSMDLGLAATPQNVAMVGQLDAAGVYAEFQQHVSAILKLASVLDSYTGRSASTAVNEVGTPLYVSMTSRYLDMMYAVATVDIPAGAACYTRMVGETRMAYLASAATAGQFCTGFCVSPQGVQAGSTVAISVCGGLIPWIGNLAEGFTYYLSATVPGGITPNIPSGAFVQPLGYALGPTSFYYIPRVPQ